MKRALFPSFSCCHGAVTGLGLILAVSAATGHAQGWDCTADANGEWLCQAALPGAGTGAEVAEGVGSGAQQVDPGTGAFLPPEGIARSPAAKHKRHSLTRLSDDWVPLEKLTEAQRQAAGVQICCGTYVDPSASGDQTNPENAQITAHADQTDSDLVNETTTLTGDVQIRQGYRYIRADQAVVKKNPRQVALNGNVELREPGLLLLSQDANVMLDDKTAQLGAVQYLLHDKHVHGDADTLARSETGVIAMTNATYTYCPVDNRQWYLKTRSLTLDPNDSQGRARNVTLHLGKVPIFYTPYLQFPLGDQRMSGFLVPSFGLGEDGLDLQAPYYVNLAPNYDLLLTPRYISDRGMMLGSKFRHMSEHTRSEIVANMLPNDSKADGDEESDRWYFSAGHHGADKRWESLVDYTAVSDSEYVHDFGSSGLRSANNSLLKQEGQFDYLPDNWRIGVLAKEYQNLSNSLVEPHELMPSLYADGEYALDNGMVFDLHHAMTRFDNKDEGEVEDKIYYDLEQTENLILAGTRYNLDYSIAYPLRTAAAFLTPKAGIRHVSQQLDGNNDPVIVERGTRLYGRNLRRDTTFFGSTPDDNPSATTGYASLDSGLIFERDTSWFGNGYKQTFEPRVFYYYSSHENQDDIYNFETNNLTFSYAQLFRDYRFSGEDYLDDANQVSVGATTRFLDPRTGRELLRASLGQSYYLQDRDIVIEDDAATTDYERNRSRSAVVAELAANINRHWLMRTEFLWNDDKEARERQSFDLRYRDEERRLFNIGYQFLDREPSVNKDGDVLDRTVEQTYVSASHPVGKNWSLIGHWNRDITNSRDLETIAGFEYESCCWTARVVGRRWAVNRRFVDDVDGQDMDQGIFFQVYFKGLGNVGDSLEGMLSDAIFGFEDRNKPLD